MALVPQATVRKCHVPGGLYIIEVCCSWLWRPVHEVEGQPGWGGPFLVTHFPCVLRAHGDLTSLLSAHHQPQQLHLKPKQSAT